MGREGQTKAAVSSGEGTGHVTESPEMTGVEVVDGQPPDETDHANYFCEYAYMYHQMDMLEDSHRTGSYFNAVMENPGCFKDKVVLDVGAGTCILSIMAARAGAKQVFAVEATDMAKRARRLVEANGLGGIIRVLQGTMETVELPCKVDVIISEWMGYFLLRESMLDSVIVARDKHLKPGGALFPSHATLYLAPLGKVKALSDKWATWESEAQHWANFVGDMRNTYDTDFSCLRDESMQEQQKYHLFTGAFATLTPKSLAGAGRPLLVLDLIHTSLDELRNPKEPLTCSMRIARDGIVEGFVGYFDAFFRGSPEMSVEQEVALSTAPMVGSSTHWGQQIFGFYPPLHACRGDCLEASMYIRRQERNPRLLRLEAKFTLYGQQADGPRVAKEERAGDYFID